MSTIQADVECFTGSSSGLVREFTRCRSRRLRPGRAGSISRGWPKVPSRLGPSGTSFVDGRLRTSRAPAELAIVDAIHDPALRRLRSDHLNQTRRLLTDSAPGTNRAQCTPGG